MKKLYCLALNYKRQDYQRTKNNYCVCGDKKRTIESEKYSKTGYKYHDNQGCGRYFLEVFYHFFAEEE